LHHQVHGAKIGLFNERAIISEQNIIMRKHSAVCFPNNARRSPGKIWSLKL